MLIHAQHGVRHEARLATDLVLGGNILHAVQHEADETVALALDAIHDRLAIGADLAFHAHAERIGMHRGMRGLGGGDQQLGRHAAHARAGRAIGAALDQQGALAGGAGGAISGQAGGAGADDGDVSMQSLHIHVLPIWRGCAVSCLGRIRLAARARDATVPAAPGRGRAGTRAAGIRRAGSTTQGAEPRGMPGRPGPACLMPVRRSAPSGRPGRRSASR